MEMLAEKTSVLSTEQAGPAETGGSLRLMSLRGRKWETQGPIRDQRVVRDEEDGALKATMTEAAKGAERWFCWAWAL